MVGDIFIRKHSNLNPGNSVLIPDYDLLHDYAKVLGVSKKDVPFEFNARSLPMAVVPGAS